MKKLGLDTFPARVQTGGGRVYATFTLWVMLYAFIWLHGPYVKRLLSPRPKLTVQCTEFQNLERSNFTMVRFG